MYRPIRENKRVILLAATLRRPGKAIAEFHPFYAGDGKKRRRQMQALRKATQDEQNANDAVIGVIDPDAQEAPVSPEQLQKKKKKVIRFQRDVPRSGAMLSGMSKTLRVSI